MKAPLAARRRADSCGPVWRPPLRNQPIADDRDGGGQQRRGEQVERDDRAAEESREDRLPGRVGRVGNDGEASARDRPFHDGQLGRFAHVGHERGEIGDERVVVERRQERRAEEQRRLAQTREHGRDPPALQSAVDDEPRQEEADQERRLQRDLGLVGARRFHESQEEQEPAEEQRGIVRVDDGPGHEERVHDDDPGWNRQQGARAGGDGIGIGHLGVAHRRALGQIAQLTAEEQVVEQRRAEHREQRAPAEVRHHVRQVPRPRARHHQDGRGREVRQRAADRDVDEQQAEGRVLQAGARVQVVELARQQQRADRHGGRLGDERAEEWSDRQQHEPPRGGGALAE